MNTGFSLFSLQCSRQARSVIIHGLLFGVVATATAQEAPVIINQETGTQVDLIRPYWNANVDIANRRMQCDHFLFDEESAVYVQRASGGHPSGTFLVDGEFFHNPLSEGGGLATVEDFIYAGLRPNGWAVTDGVYRGVTPLGESSFVEMVTYNASSNVSGNNAVRVWYTSDRFTQGTSLHGTLQRTGPSYHVCYDLDGAPLIPTGSADTGNTDLLPELNFTFQLPRSGTPVTETPEIIRIDTGEPVEFVRAEFDYNKDLKGRRMNCGSFRFNEESGRYIEDLRGVGLGRNYEFLHAYTGGPTVPVTTGPDDYTVLSGEFAVDDFLNSSVLSASHIEVVATGYNIWSSIGSFEGCRVSEPFGSESLEPFAPNIILSLAPEEPVVTDNCDYTDAADFDGWGFDPVTMTSCPPLTGDISVDETTEVANNMEGTDTIDGSNGVLTNPIPTDNTPDDSSGSSDGVNPASENEDTAVENEVIVSETQGGSTGTDSEVAVASDTELSDTQNNSTGTDLDLSGGITSPGEVTSPGEITSPGGGGSIWLPLLIFALALKRETLALRQQN